MRRWQVWFFGRWGQLLFWIVVVGAGWWMLRSTADHPRLWWPFERGRPEIAGAPPSVLAPQ